MTSDETERSAVSGGRENVAAGSRLHAVMPREETADLRDLLWQLPDGVVFIDREWRMTYANLQARAISEIKPEQVNSSSIWEQYPSRVGSESFAAYQRVMDGGPAETFEAYTPLVDKWLRLHVRGTDSGIAVVYQDVSQIHAKEKERSTMAGRLAQMLDATTDGVVSLDREWRITYLNRRAEEMLLPKTNLLGKSLFAEFPTAAEPPFVEHYRRAMDQRMSSIFDAYYPAPLEKDLHSECLPSPEGIVIFFRDVTEEKRAQEAVRKSEERYRIVTELSPQSIFTASANGQVTYANKRFMDYVGAFDPAMGAEWMNAIDPRDQEATKDAWLDAMRTGADLGVEARLICKQTGEPRWWYMRASAMRDDDGTLVQWIGTATDVHERHLAVEELERERAEMEAVYNTAPVGLLLVEPKELRYLRVNDLQAERMGVPAEQILGKRVTDMLTSPVAAENLRRVALGDTVRDYTYETEFTTRPGDLRTMNVNYSPVLADDGSVRAISIAALDVTQLRKAEKALVQSEKLAAVGRLASSISHEINNPLEAITNLLYLTMGEDGVPAQARTYIKSAQDELVRVSQIATQTLRFHRQAAKPTKVTAAQLVDAVLNLYSGRLVNSGIVVHAKYSTDTQVLCFENDIRQVLNNLIGNAIDAMRTGGRLLVRSHDAAKRDGHGDGIRIVIADTGSGMSDETKQRLFEAFYTTKDLNGTGLGLWISQEIVVRHGGKLLLRSRQAKGAEKGVNGTVFSLFLPCKGS